MPRTMADNLSQYRYNEKHLKRVPLDVQKTYYETTLKPAAAAAGVPVNTYIKSAISEKIARDYPGGVPGSAADPAGSASGAGAADPAGDMSGAGSAADPG